METHKIITTKEVKNIIHKQHERQNMSTNVIVKGILEENENEDPTTIAQVGPVQLNEQKGAKISEQLGKVWLLNVG